MRLLAGSNVPILTEENPVVCSSEGDGTQLIEVPIDDSIPIVVMREHQREEGFLGSP